MVFKRDLVLKGCTYLWIKGAVDAYSPVVSAASCLSLLQIQITLT